MIWYWEQFCSGFKHRFSVPVLFLAVNRITVVSCLIIIQLCSTLSKTVNLPVEIGEKKLKRKSNETIFQVEFFKTLHYWSKVSPAFIFLWFHISPRHYFWQYYSWLWQSWPVTWPFHVSSDLKSVLFYVLKWLEVPFSGRITPPFFFNVFWKITARLALKSGYSCCNCLLKMQVSESICKRPVVA